MRNFSEEDFNLGPVLLAYAGYAVTAGTVLVTISQLTVDDGAFEKLLMN
ncbi:hypothetical protein [Algoriphagus aquimarinus]